MPAICLPKLAIDKFRAAFKSGQIDPEKLTNMSSEDRHAFFAKLSSKEDATTINSLFESKLLLKNQERGLVNWAKTITGVTEPVRRDLIAKVQRLDRVLNPEDKQAFFKDLAQTKLGVSVTQDEAHNIATMSKTIQDLAAKRNADGTWNNRNTGLNYGRAVYDFHKYIGDLKTSSDKLKLFDFKGLGTIRSAPRVVKAVNDVSKAIGASLDDSFAFRQGMKAFWTDFPRWQKEFRSSFVNIGKSLKNHEAVSREIYANLIANPHYELAVRSGLGVKGVEDVFPTTFPEKIPLLGRAFSASEVGFGAFAQNLRMGIFSNELKLAEKHGVNINDLNNTKQIAKMVNSLTGKGTFGKGEHVASTINPVFYSLRFLKSNIDTLLLHPAGIGVGGLGSAAQKKAAVNLAKVVVGTASILATANALKPGSVEFDPRSADFGKIRVGDTRFDISAGMGSMLTLAARLASQSSKSSTTKQITPLNSGKFGSQTEWDTIMTFFSNKLSPSAGLVRDKFKGKDPQGNPFNLKNEVVGLATPLGVKNFQELQSNKNSADKLFSVIADGLGVSTNTYGATQGGMTGTSKEVQTFKQNVGADKFKQANTDYTNKLNDWTTKIGRDKNYLNLDQATQKNIVTAEKAKIQSDVFKNYGFKYKAQKSNRNQIKQFLK